jgi:FkbM family methyltransferase
LRRWFDVVIPLDPAFGPGLAQKLHLDAYSPFEQTLYIDADCLVYSDLNKLWDQFRDAEGLSLFGLYIDPGGSHYAVDDLDRYMAELDISRMVMTNTGMLYFDRSTLSGEAFETARSIAKRGHELGLRSHPVGFFNDEPIFGAVVEMLGLPVVSSTLQPVFTLGSFGTDDMSDINVIRQDSRQSFDGRPVQPSAIHFNVDSQHSKLYDRELRRLELSRRDRGTAVADLVTELVWAVRTLRDVNPTELPKSAGWRLLASEAIKSRLPHDLYAGIHKPTAAQLVARVRKRSRRPFTFVQVGSNDGLTGDPLFDTVMGDDVRGLLIEPVPELYERLIRNYQGKDGLVFAQVAVADREGERPFYWVSPLDGDPIWVDQLGSFSKEIVLSHADEVRDLANRIMTLQVPCRTISSLLMENGFEGLDLLHIDAEGADFEILKTIDFSADSAPRHILYEQKHLGADAGTAREFLQERGYDTIGVGPDVFAYRRPRRRLPLVKRLASSLAAPESQ